MINILYKITKLPLEICDNIYLNIIKDYSQISKVKVVDFYYNDDYQYLLKYLYYFSYTISLSKTFIDASMKPEKFCVESFFIIEGVKA